MSIILKRWNKRNVTLVESNIDEIELMETSMKNTLTRDEDSSMSRRSIHAQTQTNHAFWNLCKGYVGAASFALPWAVSQTGIIPAVIGFFLLSSLAYLTFRWMLIASHHALNNLNPTYPELAEITFKSFFSSQLQAKDTNNSETTASNERNAYMRIPMEDVNGNVDKTIISNHDRKCIQYMNRCGTCGKVVVYLCMFCGMIGACGSYILFISGVIQHWLSPIFDTQYSFYVSICILLPFVIALSLLRSYSFLSSTAKFGVAGVVLALVVTIYDGIVHIHDGKINMDVLRNNLVYVDLSGFPIFVGNACFLFVIHVMILSQEQSMSDRGNERFVVSSQFKKANNLSLLLVTFVNMIFALFAYVSFVDSVPFPDNIVDGLDHGIIQQITRGCLCIDLLFTYALIMYPFTEALDTELFDITQLANSRIIKIKGNIIRCAIVVVTAGIAIGIPHFGYLTGLTGGSASVFLGFILPPLFIWRLAPHKIYKVELYVLCPSVFVFGCVMFIWSPYLILSKMYS